MLKVKNSLLFIWIKVKQGLLLRQISNSANRKNFSNMTTQINNVTDSKTYQVYNQLLELGFNATLSSMFAYNYDKDNRYPSITVREADERLNELYEATREMEVLLTKYVKENNPCFEIRKHRDYAEFVSENVWNEYHSSLTA